LQNLSLPSALLMKVMVRYIRNNIKLLIIKMSSLSFIGKNSLTNFPIFQPKNPANINTNAPSSLNDAKPIKTKLVSNIIVFLYRSSLYQFVA